MQPYRPGQRPFVSPLVSPTRRRIRQPRGVGCYLRGCIVLLLTPMACISLALLSYILLPPEPMDIVILGVDARPGQGYLTRTDSIMLLNTTPGELSVSLLSIPRDVFINVPGYGEQRINTINVLGEQETPGTGGPALVRDSFQTSFAVGVDRYVRLDFDGFAALIDAVGGIDINVPNLIVDYEFPTADGGTIEIRFEPGQQHMDGERALQYARTRHQDDDFRRAERQQQVFDALIKKLADPRQAIYWPRVLHTLLNNTDTDLNAWDIIQLGPTLFFGWPNRDHRVLVREDLVDMQGYWVPDYDEIMPWIEENFD